MLSEKKTGKSFDVVIVGGLGRVGFPLGLVFAREGLKVCLYDTDSQKANIVKKGKMPFIEYDGEQILKKTAANGKLNVSDNPVSISKAEYVVIAIGTPIDEHLNPRVRSFLDTIAYLKKYLNRTQTIIVRSTVYPHTCRQMLKLLGGKKLWRVAYCPERIVQGYAVCWGTCAFGECSPP